MKEKNKIIDGLKLKVEIYRRDIENVNKSITTMRGEKIDLRRKISNLECLHDEIDDLK